MAVDPNLAGYTGGFTDGRSAYFVPNYNGTTAQQHGKLARVDLNNYSVRGVTAIDLTTIDSALKGFFGGFTNGRYGYLVPSNNSSSGKIARIDLRSFITITVTVLDLAAVDTGLKGFTGGFSDGHFGYFVPYQNGGTYHGKVARVDLQNFAAGGVTVLDLAGVDTAMKGFVGGFTDGRYGFMPNLLLPRKSRPWSPGKMRSTPVNIPVPFRYSS